MSARRWEYRGCDGHTGLAVPGGIRWGCGAIVGDGCRWGRWGGLSPEDSGHGIHE